MDKSRRPEPHKPLSALLSQILVVYTVELDWEFERRMLETQSRSARLSLVLWLNVLRFLADGPVSVRTLASRALTRATRKLARQTGGGAPIILPGDVPYGFNLGLGEHKRGIIGKICFRLLILSRAG